MIIEVGKVYAIKERSPYGFTNENSYCQIVKLLNYDYDWENDIIVRVVEFINGHSGMYSEVRSYGDVYGFPIKSKYLLREISVNKLSNIGKEHLMIPFTIRYRE